MARVQKPAHGPVTPVKAKAAAGSAKGASPRPSAATSAATSASGGRKATAKVAPAKATAAKQPAKAATKAAAVKAAPAKVPAAKAPKSVAATKATAPAAAPAAKASPPRPAGPPVKGARPEPVRPVPGDKFLAEQQELLFHERVSHVRQAESLKEEADTLAAEMEPGESEFGEEGGEGGNLSVERELDLVLSAQAKAAVDEIDRALAKIDAGTYGMCEKCGKEIPKARLKVLPHAPLCVACKSGGLSRR